MRNSTACSSRNTSVSQPLETQISTTHQKQPVPMCQSHVDTRFPMERSASTKIRNPSVTLHKQACTMLSKWSVIWVGNTFPQGDAGLLRLLAVRNDLGPAPSKHQNTGTVKEKCCIPSFYKPPYWDQGLGWGGGGAEGLEFRACCFGFRPSRLSVHSLGSDLIRRRTRSCGRSVLA